METEKTPKKRGRKPGSKNKVKKEKLVLEKTPEKKKRGRKPKTNITINENPIFTSDQKKNENLIIKINNVSIDSLDDINKLENNFNFNNNIENEINNNEKYTNGKLCWNCCHSFPNRIEGLPIKYVDNIFYTYGNFCSLECATRYCFDNLNNDAAEIYSITNLYNIIINNNNKEIKCAPHRLTLDIFGGRLSIDEYRKSFNTTDYYNVTIPPLVQLSTQISLPEKNRYYNKEHLKIYRKKEINNQNNIISMMNNN